MASRSSFDQNMSVYKKLEQYCSRAIEASWLLAIGVIPILMVHEDWMLGFIQVPKTSLLRTIALILIVLLSLKWAVAQQASASVQDSDHTGPRPSRKRRYRDVSVSGSATRDVTPVSRFSQWLTKGPSSWVYIGTILVVVATLVSTAFSPLPGVAFWGMEPGWDTYAAFNTLSYVVIFIAVASHFRNEGQLKRLMVVVTAASIVASLYGIIQHFGVELLQPSRSTLVTVREQATLTMGNPIFAGSYLIMTIPLILAWSLTLVNRLGWVQQILIGTSAITIQTTALLFTYSRGPWVGFAVAMIAFVGIVGLTMGKRYATRATIITTLALGLALIMTVLPTPEKGASDAHNVGERVVSIVPAAFGGGMTYRTTIWKTAGKAFIESPWLNTQEFPEIPSLSIRSMRPIIGYGPDTFAYPYSMIGETTYTAELATHGHNFIVQTAIELGLLGVMGYITLLVALGLSLRRLIQLARIGQLSTFSMLVVSGLSAILLGRIVEQSVGKAQMSDLLQSWVLAGVIVGVLSMYHAVMQPDQAPIAHQSAPRSKLARAKAPNLPKLIVPFTTFILICVIWSITIYPNITASRMGAKAQTTMEAGRTVAAFGELERSIDLAYPTAPMMLLLLSDWAFQAAWGEINPNLKLALFQKSHNLAQDALAWNAMDPRAWTASSNAMVELAALSPQFRDRAIRENVVFANIMPGFWQARYAIGQAHLRLGEPEQALRAFEQALGLGPSTADGVAITFYAIAVAYYELGLPDKALDAALSSWQATPSTQIIELFNELGVDPENL